MKHYTAGVRTSNLQRHLAEAHKVERGKKKPAGANLKTFFSPVPRPHGSGNKKNVLARDFFLWLARDLLIFNLVDGAELQVIRTVTSNVMFTFVCLPYRCTFKIRNSATYPILSGFSLTLQN